ncbi:hypothetical protein C2G38_2228654 [Gigaspora rosea]|uniref:Uncharacterized protein n=1 Tax=Gigaspora rosea TaxID=44941 RepID=A0A397U3Z4_9GLOM|nr:hypothetical protein C2G38_2228654 [Gigaspora rosea]
MANQNTHMGELTDEPKPLADQESVQIEEKDKELHQYVRFKIIMLNEEYKSYRINMKIRFNICIAQIFIALISYFIGQILSIAKHINTTDGIGKIGPVISSIFVIAGTITTIFTVYLNHSSDKYFERNGNTEITENLFKPMFLNIDTKILKNLYEFRPIGRIVFRNHDNQPSDEQNPAWEIIYFGCFVINNLELYPSEEFAIKSILNGAVFTDENHEEKYDPGIINKTLTSKYSYRTLRSKSNQQRIF